MSSIARSTPDLMRVQRYTRAMDPLEAFAATRRRIQTVIMEELSTILQAHRRPSMTTPFAELGLDSIMAMDLRDRLQDRLSVVLPATIVFDHPTVRGLCTAVHQHLDASEMAAQLDAEVDAVLGEDGSR